MKCVNGKITSFFTSNKSVKRPCDDESEYLESKNTNNQSLQIPVTNNVISTDISLFVNRCLY